MFYFGSYFALLILSIKETFFGQLKKKPKIMLLVVFTLVFSIVSAIRINVGTDYWNYYEIFEYISSRHFLYIEPGFVIITMILNSLNLDPHAIFFVFSLLTFAFLSIGLYKFSPINSLALLIYLSLFLLPYSFNAVRQALSMSIFIYLLDDIYIGKTKKVLLFSLLAISIHITGIVIPLSYIVVKFRLNQKRVLLTIGISILFYLTKSFWSEILIAFSPTIIKDYLILYMNRFGDPVGTVSYLSRFALIVICSYHYFIQRNYNQKYDTVFKIYLFGFFLYSLLSFESMYSTRINMFFRILEICLFAFMIKSNQPRYYRYLLFIFIVLYTFLTYSKIAINPDYAPLEIMFFT